MRRATQITNEKNDALSALLERAPALFEKMKNTFASKKKKKDDAKEADVAETEEEVTDDENE